MMRGDKMITDQAATVGARVYAFHARRISLWREWQNVATDLVLLAVARGQVSSPLVASLREDLAEIRSELLATGEQN